MRRPAANQQEQPPALTGARYRQRANGACSKGRGAKASRPCARHWTGRPGPAARPLGGPAGPATAWQAAADPQLVALVPSGTGQATRGPGWPDAWPAGPGQPTDGSSLPNPASWGFLGRSPSRPMRKRAGCKALAALADGLAACPTCRRSKQRRSAAALSRRPPCVARWWRERESPFSVTVQPQRQHVPSFPPSLPWTWADVIAEAGLAVWPCSLPTLCCLGPATVGHAELAPNARRSANFKRCRVTVANWLEITSRIPVSRR